MTTYDLTMPAFVRGLKNLLVLIAKAEKNAKERGFSADEFVTARLAPDQFNFAKQIQYAYFVALDAGTNLGGKEMPKFSYKEKNMGELKNSVKKTISFLEKIKPGDVEKTNAKRVPLFWEQKKTVPVEIYIKQVALPMFYFHLVTAYAILRHNGVPLGMDDYVGKIK